MKVLLLTVALSFLGACSSPQEKYEERQAEAKEEYEEDLKEAEEDFSESKKDEAVEMVEDSDGVQIKKDEGQINVE